MPPVLPELRSALAALARQLLAGLAVPWDRPLGWVSDGFWAAAYCISEEFGLARPSRSCLASEDGPQSRCTAPFKRLKQLRGSLAQQFRVRYEDLLKQGSELFEAKQRSFVRPSEEAPRP